MKKQGSARRRPWVLCVFAAVAWVWLAGPAAAQNLSFPGDVNFDFQLTAQDAVVLANLLAGNLAPDNDFSAGDPCLYDSIVGILRFVPSGEFQQGLLGGDPCTDPNNSFIHHLSRDLAVMETEVTQGMWAALQAADPVGFPPANPSALPGSSLPVDQVTWSEAVLFANRLSVLRGLTPCYYADAAFTTPIDKDNYTTPGQTFYCNWAASGYRLPSEGEWEYFCRAGTTTPFSVVEDFPTCSSDCTPGLFPALESVAWFCANSDHYMHPAGQKMANPWGLRDVHGNVYEWCWDWYGAYPTGSVTDYRGWPVAPTRVFRGGRNGGPRRDAGRRPALHGARRPQPRGFRLMR